jgi:hypothetical protein
MEHHSCIHWPSLARHLEGTHDTPATVVVGPYRQTRRGELTFFNVHSSGGLEWANIQRGPIVDQDLRDLGIHTFDSYVESSVMPSPIGRSILVGEMMTAPLFSTLMMERTSSGEVIIGTSFSANALRIASLSFWEAISSPQMEM